MHAQIHPIKIIEKKGAMGVKESWEEYVGGFGGWIGKEETLQFLYNPQNKID